MRLASTTSVDHNSIRKSIHSAVGKWSLPASSKDFPILTLWAHRSPSASLGPSVVLGNLIQYSGLNPLVVVFISLHVVLEHKWFSLVGKIYLHTSSVGHI